MFKQCLLFLGLTTSFIAIAADKYKLAFEIAPPFSYVDENYQAHGLALELVQAVIDEVNGELSYVTCPWARCLKLVEQGQVDFIFGIVKTPARDKFLRYIEPPFTKSFTEIALYQLKTSNQDITHYEQLMNKTIGVQRGAAHVEEFDDNPKIKKVSVVDIPSVIELLKKKRIDAFIMPTQSAEQYLSQHDPAGEITQASFSFRKEQGGYIALSKKSPHIDKIEQLNTGLTNIMANGKLKAILKKYDLH